MKRIVRSPLISLFACSALALSVFPASDALANNYDIDEPQWESLGGSVRAPGFRVVAQTPDYIDLEISVQGYERAAGLGEALGYEKISLPDSESTLDKIGYPELPVIARHIALPTGANPWVEVLADERSSQASDAVMPAQPAGVRCIADDIPFTTYHSAYEAGGVYPASNFELGAVQQAGNQSFARLQIHPFHFDPASNTLEVSTTMRVRLHYGTPYTAHAANLRTRNSFDRAMSSNLVGALSDRTRNEGQVYNEAMAIVVGKDSFKAALEPYIAWKRARGLKVIVKTVSEMGGNAQGIKSGLQSLYDDSETNLTYVLLVGDEKSVPTFSKRYGKESSQEDYKFGLLKGSDSTADAFVGRFVAASDEHVKTQMNRVLYYERDLGNGEDAGDLGWIKTGVGIASMEPTKAGATTDIMRMNKVEQTWKSAGYTEVTRINEGQQKPNLAAALSEGRGWVSYMGHGSGSAWVFGKESGRWRFSNQNIAQVKNPNKWPVIVDCSCLNGAYHTRSAFDEVWAQLGSSSAPLGALASIASTISAAWVEPALMVDAFAKHSIARKELQPLGAVYYKSLADMLAQKGNSASAKTRDTFIIFGDPSLQVRNDIPTKLSAESQVEDDKVEITVSREDKKAAAGAVVALSTDEELVVAGTTDASGKVTLELPSGTEADELNLVVTGLNLVALQEKLDAKDGGGDDPDDDESEGGDESEGNASGDDPSSGDSKDNSDNNSDNNSDGDSKDEDPSEASKGNSDENSEDDDDSKDKGTPDPTEDEDSEENSDEDSENGDETGVEPKRGCDISQNGSGAPSMIWLSLLGLGFLRRRKPQA